MGKKLAPDSIRAESCFSEKIMPIEAGLLMR